MVILQKNSQVDTSRFCLREDGDHNWNYWENMGEITYIKQSVVTKLNKRKKKQLLLFGDNNPRVLC